MMRYKDTKYFVTRDGKIWSAHYSYDPTAHAKEILTELEKEAMKPKGYYGLMASGKKYDPELHKDREAEYFHNWEPEDENN